MGKTGSKRMDGCTVKQAWIDRNKTLQRIHVKDILATKNPEIINMKKKKKILEQGSSHELLRLI